jgi:polyisoprenoid-binding protein YceI
MAVAVQPFSGDFIADSNHSSVQFSVARMKVSRFRASFADVDARLVADGDDVRLEGRARVDSISITEPPELREHVVSGKVFFDATDHPELRLPVESRRLRRGGTRTCERRARAAGRHPADRGERDLPATGRRSLRRNPRRDRTRGTIDRREWGFDWQMPMPDGDDMLGWKVELDVRLELVSVDSRARARTGQKPSPRLLQPPASGRSCAAPSLGRRVRALVRDRRPTRVQRGPRRSRAPACSDAAARRHRRCDGSMPRPYPREQALEPSG